MIGSVKHRDTPESAILRTLLYASVFHAGILIQDLECLLITPQSFSRRQIQTSLTALVQRKTIFQKDSWIWMGKEVSYTALKRKYAESAKKKKRLFSLLPLISWIPTIQGIAITGSVAVGNANPSEDIDLMIITSTGFLWTTRVLVEGILFVCRVLRTRGMKNVRNKLCLNLWLEEGSLLLPTHSLYVARELIQADWVICRDQIREHMLAHNTWIRAFLHGSSYKKHPRDYRVSQVWYVSLCSVLLEPLAFFVQTSYMRSKTREIVTKQAAFFHPRDTQGSVLKKYADVCRRSQIDSLVRE